MSGEECLRKHGHRAAHEPRVLGRAIDDARAFCDQQRRSRDRCSVGRNVTTLQSSRRIRGQEVRELHLSGQIFLEQEPAQVAVHIRPLRGRNRLTDQLGQVFGPSARTNSQASKPTTL